MNLGFIPFAGLAGRTGSFGRPVWRRLSVAFIAFALLVVAPMVAHAQSDSVTVTWTAPGDDGTIGRASGYDLRISEFPIDGSNFNSALQVPGVPAPQSAGAAQRIVVRGLSRTKVYYFSIRTVDDNGNWSGLSNLERWDWNFDTAPPAAPRNARAARQSSVVHVSWDANTESDLAGYYVYRRVGSGGATTRITPMLIASPQFDDGSAPADPAEIWYEVSAVDINGNESAHSSGAHVGTAAGGAWALDPGYPNPSRVGQSARFPIIVPPNAGGGATLTIFDGGSQVVRRLEISNPTPGPIEVTWDGRNDAGRDTAPGVYRAWLIAGDTRLTVRVLRVP